MKLLNFGSLNIDYVYAVDHFVRPGETIRADKMERFCGGKGLNQSVALARAGTPVCHAGKIGKDGAELRRVLADAGVDVTHVMENGDVTGHAVIQVDAQGQNCILLYSGANHDISTELIDTTLAEYGSGDILLLQNEINNLSYIMAKAHEKGIRIALNPSPINDDLLACPLESVTWFILNEIEGNALSGETEPEKIADRLLQRYPHCAVVLTLGRRGVLYRDACITETHGIYHIARVDTTGAGDTFTGFFLSGVCRGLPVAETLRQASVAASLAVSRKGASASIPTLPEVLQASLSPES